MMTMSECPLCRAPLLPMGMVSIRPSILGVDIQDYMDAERFDCSSGHTVFVIDTRAITAPAEEEMPEFEEGATVEFIEGTTVQELLDSGNTSELWIPAGTVGVVEYQDDDDEVTVVLLDGTWLKVDPNDIVLTENDHRFTGGSAE
jgi:hypothetical protein